MSKSTRGWSDLVVQEVVAALTPLADPAKAPAMRAYMKDVAPFLGISSPLRSAALRPVWKAVGKAPSARDLGDAATELFERDQREFAYAALDLLGRNNKIMDEAFLVDVVEPLILTKSWWDTVDSLRSEAVGPLVRSYPSLLSVIHRWAASDNRWLVRSAIIHQLGYNEHTDVDLLFDLCRMHAHQTEFFIAKGIGWALRDYSYTDPDAVEEFITTTDLRPLSKREGMKANVRKRARATA
jgi:3-methyladenine DNA glycosylase AlkD